MPASSWRAEDTYPDLSRCKYVAIDTETDDPNLETKGPGFIRGDAKVCGISITAGDDDEIAHSLYFPIAHLEDNLDKDKVISYLKAQLKGEQEKIFANVSYDLEALNSLNIRVGGELNDIQIAEPLLNEDKQNGYSLEVLSQEYLGYGKDEGLLKEASNIFGVTFKKGMANLPARYVGPYAIQDSDNTYSIYMEQKQRLRVEEVLRIYHFERKLVRTLFKLRLKGVKVNLDKAAQLAKETEKKEELLKAELHRMAERPFLTSSTTDIAGILINVYSVSNIPKTLKQNYSITNEWLKAQTHIPFCVKLVELRKMEKMRRDFMENILENNVNGRIHSVWHSLRETKDEDEGGTKGTRSGRMASSNINLQQIPARDKDWGPLIRSLFIPDHDKAVFIKADFASQEPRIALHYAYTLHDMGRLGFESSAEIIKKYEKNVGLDYHNMVRELVLKEAGVEISRKDAKTINLGILYGMGLAKLAYSLGFGENKKAAQPLLDAYFKGIPFVKNLMNATMKRASDQGFIRTILGRKRRFPLWITSNYEIKHKVKPVASMEEAIQIWGNKVERANIHKALNAIVQGSAADQTKSALMQLDEAGLLPSMAVHDEMAGSYESEEDGHKIAKIMEHAVPNFKVRFMAEVYVGDHWGFTEDNEPIPRIGGPRS